MHGEADNIECLTEDEIDIIRGALALNDKTAEDAMQPIESVFSLPFSEKLTGVVMDRILDVGHSRIPVWQSDPEQMAVGREAPPMMMAELTCVACAALRADKAADQVPTGRFHAHQRGAKTAAGQCQQRDGPVHVAQHVQVRQRWVWHVRSWGRVISAIVTA